jgi:hypothetical protein
MVIVRVPRQGALLRSTVSFCDTGLRNWTSMGPASLTSGQAGDLA